MTWFNVRAGAQQIEASSQLPSLIIIYLWEEEQVDQHVFVGSSLMKPSNMQRRKKSQEGWNYIFIKSPI